MCSAKNSRASGLLFIVIVFTCFEALTTIVAADEGKIDERKMVVQKWCKLVNGGICKNATLLYEHPNLGPSCDELVPWCAYSAPRSDKDYDDILEKIRVIQSDNSPGYGDKSGIGQSPVDGNSSLVLLPSAVCKR